MTAPATVQNFSGREERYARHRWDYAPEAIDYIVEAAQLTEASTMADMGAGTGMLTAHFLGRASRVFAIEPNAEMRQTLCSTLGVRPDLTVVDAYSDNTTLPDAAVDLIAVGRALHWFPPATTRTEFLRILKPGGWLAVLRIPCADESLLAAIKSLKIAENGWNTELDEVRQQQAPHSFYFGHDTFLRMRFPAVLQEGWEDFFGRLCSFAVAPTPAHPRFATFEAAAQAVFDRFSVGGQLTVATVTELSLGRII